MNILAVGAHYDDIELGCGGTLINHVEKGNIVWMLVVSESGYEDPSGNTIRESHTAKKEGEKAAGIIGANLISLNYKTFFIPDAEKLTTDILNIITRYSIDTIYTHWTGDIHRDHRNTTRCVLMAARHVSRVLMYQSNWYDGDQAFIPLIYSNISGMMNRKLEAVRAHKTEVKRTGSTWIEYLKNRHRMDGLKIGVEYAETFEPIKYLIPF